MNRALKASAALGFIVAIPLFAFPTQAAPTLETGYRQAYYQTPDFGSAMAFVRPGKPAVREPQNDGLSRNDEECNTGCIDH